MDTLRTNILDHLSNNATVYAVIIMVIVVLAFSTLLTFGIDDMNKKYPDYKGEDFLNEEEKKNGTN